MEISPFSQSDSQSVSHEKNVDKSAVQDCSKIGRRFLFYMAQSSILRGQKKEKKKNEREQRNWTTVNDEQTLEKLNKAILSFSFSF